MKRATLIKAGLPLLVIGIGVAGFVYMTATRPQTDPRAVAERVWPVAAVEAEKVTVTPEMQAYGRIAAGREVELRPLVEGRVVETGPEFNDGGVVGEGDLLIAIDTFDYLIRLDEAHAQLAEARARREEIAAELKGSKDLLATDREQVAIRERDVERREQLSKRGATSEKALDDSRLALVEARQRLIQRRRDIRQMETREGQQEAVIARLEAAIRQAERNLDNARLTAPFAGFLVDVSTELGKQVSRNDPVARLIDSKRLEARFQLSNDDFGRLLEAGDWRGRPARVVWSVGGRRFEYAARIDRIEGEIEAARGGVELFARIAEAGTVTPLRPGAFVEVYVPGREYENVIRVPDAALHENKRVFVSEGGRLKAVEVQVEGRSGNDALIRGDIAPGAEIVITRFPEIAAGLRVEVR